MIHVAWTASIAFVGGLALVASKIDGEFDDFMSATLIKVTEHLTMDGIKSAQFGILHCNMFSSFVSQPHWKKRDI